MSQIVKLEKRFETALEKLELALAKNNVMEPLEVSYKKAENTNDSHYNIDELLVKIEKLEKAAKSDANEINKLVRKLEEIFELEDD